MGALYAKAERGPRWRIGVAVCLTGWIGAGDARPATPVFVRELTNGLRVVVESVPEPLVTVAMVYGAGVRTGLDGGRELAALVARLMQPDAADPASRHPGIGAAGEDARIVPGLDHTAFVRTAPREALGDVLDAEAERLRAFRATPQRLAADRAGTAPVPAVFEPDPHAADWRALLELARAGASGADRGAAGSQITAADVQRYAEAFFVPNNAALVVVGDVGPFEVVSLATARFWDVPARRRPASPVEPAQPVGPRERRVERRDLRSPVILAAYPAPPRGTPEFAALCLIDAWLAGDASARLVRRLRDQLHLVSGVSTTLSPLGVGYETRDPGYYGWRIEVAPGATPDAVRREIDRSMSALGERPIADDELAVARVRFRGQFRWRVGEAAPAIRRALFLGATSLLADFDRTRLLPDEVDRVTPALVDRVAREYLVSTRRVLLTLVPAPAG